MIFAREITSGLTSLVKKIDEATAKNSDARMGSFIVFLSDNEDLEKQLKDLARKEKLENIVLTIDNPSGPRGYEVSKDAAVTVVFYNKRKVEANHAFRTANLADKDIEAVMK